MKKFLLVAIILSTITACGCGLLRNDTSSWKTIEIKSVGTFKIPNDWKQNEKNGLMYFSNSNSEEINEIYIFQSNSVSFDEEKSDKESNVISNDFIGLKCVKNEIFSNGTSIGEERVSINGISQQLKLISFDSDDSITYDFYVWDNNIDDKVIYSIANSFESYDLNE